MTLSKLPSFKRSASCNSSLPGNAFPRASRCAIFSFLATDLTVPRTTYPCRIKKGAVYTVSALPGMPPRNSLTPYARRRAELKAMLKQCCDTACRQYCNLLAQVERKTPHLFQELLDDLSGCIAASTGNDCNFSHFLVTLSADYFKASKRQCERYCDNPSPFGARWMSQPCGTYPPSLITNTYVQLTCRAFVTKPLS